MKVLMVNTPDALRFRGGDLTQLRETAQALRALGVEVEESFDPLPDAGGFDIAHVFNLRTVGVTPKQVGALTDRGVPVVMSPIYLNPSLASWGNRTISNIFSKVHDEQELKRLLSQLASRELKVKLPGGGTLTAATEYRPRPDYDNIQRETLERVDYLLPNSMLEMGQLVKTLRVLDKPFTVVPYGADADTFLDPDPKPFLDRYGLSDFVLQVARIEPSKNQLMLAHALRETGLRLVLIGGTLQPRYVEWCREHGPDDLVVISHLEHDELCGAYAAARVHALPSWIETCGIVTMEAALAGCSVVASIAGYEIEYYGDLVRYCDPADVDSIRAAVVETFDQHEAKAERRQMLRKRIMHDYTWERAAQLTLEAYRCVLDGA